jgi:putative SOS response-associated peptidase YedK
MCGRAYHVYTEEQLESELEVISEWNKRRRNPIKNLKPNYNLCPTQETPVIFYKKDDFQIDLFRWGLVPFWAKSVKDASKYSLINAVSEEIEEKRSYKAAFKSRRCLVPLSGFYEWHRPTEGNKTPYAISLKTVPIMTVAGIWENWESEEGKEKLYSFSILTTHSNSFMKKIHKRMPVIIDQKYHEQWLDPENKNLERLKKLFKPCSSRLLQAWEISTLVNSPKNNRPELLDKVRAAG